MNTTQLEQALDELAEDALSYSDADRAVAAAERGRRRRRLAMPVVAACVVAVIGAGWLARPAPKPDRLAPPASGLPAEVVPSTTRPAALPADRGVGRGAVVYRSCETCGLELLLASGKRYALPAKAPSTQVASLSPDGRWLAVSEVGAFVVRDLTGTTKRGLLGEYSTTFEVIGWSPRGGWALIARRDSSGELGGELRMNLATGKIEGQLVAKPVYCRAVAVLDSGELLITKGRGGRVDNSNDCPDLQLRARDSLATRPVPMDASRVLRAGERLSDAHEFGGRLVVSAAGEIAFPLAVSDPDQGTAVIMVPSGSGPARRLQPSYLSGSVWGPVGFVGHDLLVDRVAGQRHELLRVDSVTGARLATARIGAGIWSYAAAGMAEMMIIT